MDRSLSFLAFFFLSVPEILSGLLLVWLAAGDAVVPIAGMRSLDYDLFGPLTRLGDVARHLVLPPSSWDSSARGPHADRCARTCLTSCGWTTSHARAKGLPESAVIVRHALRNALNPLITLFGFTLGSLVSGSFIVETIFGWPGLGSITIEALGSQDQYPRHGSVLLASTVLIAGNLVADLLLAAADPRIRHE